MIRCIPCNGAGCDFCGQRGHHTLNKSRRHRAPELEKPMTTNTDTELLAWAAAQTWSTFAVDVAAKGKRFGLTDRQRASLENMRQKCDSRSRPETAKRKPVAGFEAAVAMLDHIDASGNKWPKVFLSLKADVEDDDDRRVKLYRYQSGDRSGQLGMKLGENWLGDIDRAGNWTPSVAAGRMTDDSKAKLWTVLKLLRDDPKTLFARNGKLLGTCASCGRALSNEESVRVGIGPECRGKFGGMV